jgi:ubiquinone/menaquinone biosynthesis C-methylase UbiE
MPNYRYQFDDSALKRMAGNFESRIGVENENHEEDFFDMLRLLVALKAKGALMDVGAGIGRLTAQAKETVAEIVALEPDQERWQACYDSHHEEPGCLVLQQTTTEYIRNNPGKEFDLIIISMVLQHISTGDCLRLLSEIEALLKDDGIALIYTTHSLEETRGFSLSGDPEAMYMSEQDFNFYAESDPSEQKMGLPVRRISKSELMDVLPSGIKPIYWRQSSFYTKIGLENFSKQLKIAPEKLADVGKNQFLVVEKTP